MSMWTGTWRVVALLLATLAATPAQATVILYTNKAAFLAATGSTSATGALPSLNGGGPDGTFTAPNEAAIGSVFVSGPRALYVGRYDWSTVIPGNEMAMSGLEDFTLRHASAVYALGFEMHEPTAPRTQPVSVQTDTCNVSACVDSTYSLIVALGGLVRATFPVNAPDDTLAFFGVWSDEPIDRLRMLETTGDAENEYFGQVYAGTRPYGVVSEPGALALLLGALGLVGRASRRLTTLRAS